MILGKSSLSKLSKVHPDLVRVVKRAIKITPIDFTVTCGIRSLAEQKMLVAKGASKTMRSRHLPGKTNGLSHAIDLAPLLEGKLRWDWPLFHKMAPAMFTAAREEGVTIEWGGNWKTSYTAALSKTFADGPHFQLPWNKYPG